MGQPRPLFRLFSFIFVFFKQALQFLQQINAKTNMSIQYTAPGFKPTTFNTRVSSHNHQTRAPAMSPQIHIFSFFNLTFTLDSVLHLTLSHPILFSLSVFPSQYSVLSLFSPVISLSICISHFLTFYTHLSILFLCTF